jgi:hypothetical protein
MNGVAFEEQTSTMIVNAHGALIQLRTVVKLGDLLQVKNLKTAEELHCKVVDINPGSNGVQEVGIEFAEPNPRFWRVSFPPSDWSPRSAEAKRFSTASTPAAVAKKQPLEKK